MKIKFKRILVQLLRLNSSPPEIALGVAIGVFICILPLYGLHTVMVIIAALLVRPANKIAILVGTNLSLPPTVPFITWAGYEIGRFMLGAKKYPPLAWSDLKNISFQKVADLYLPLFLGSIVLGLICAAIFYFIAYLIVQNFKERRKRALPR